MNTEQLGAEFEAWCLANGYSTDGHEQAEGRREGYFAAAKSRDELIEKLKVTLLRASWLLVRAEVSLKDARYVHTAEDCSNMINDIQQALAEAKAQGYRE